MRTLGWSSVLVLAISFLACGDSTGTGGTGGSGGSNTGGDPGTGGTPEGAGNDAGGAGGAGPMTPCEEICAFDESLEEEIQCGYDGGSCVVDCEAGFAATPMDCHDEAIGYNDCLIAQPADSYNCTNMIFTLSTGACDEQLGALSDCVNGV